MAHYFDTTVLGGLPVTIAYTVAGNEVYEWWITAIAGRDVKKSPQWLYKRIREAGEMSAIGEELAEAAYWRDAA